MKPAGSLIKKLFLCLFFATPLIFTLFNSELFELPKMYFVYFVTILILTLHFYNYFLGFQPLIRRTRLSIPLFIFLLSQIVSTFFSADPHTSIFGYYSRLNGGLLSLISYFVLYQVLVVYVDEKFKKQIINTSLISGFLIASFGILEHFGIDQKYWVQDVQNRVFSTLGQPNWLAAYLCILICFSFCSIHNTYYLLLTTILTLCLIYTKSKSGIIAALISLPFCLNKKNFYYFFVVIAITAFFFLNKKIPTATPTTLNITASSDIRKIVWQGALKLFSQHPLVGTGPETFAYTYYWVRPLSHNLTSEWEFLYNKAHNEYLNYLATTGVFGFLSYIAVILTSLYLLFKFPIFLAAYLSILITNFAGFSVVITSIYFFLLPALIETPLDTTKHPTKNKLILIPLVLVSFLLIKNIVSFYLADIAHNQGYDSSAIALNPYEPLYFSQLALQYSQDGKINEALMNTNIAYRISPLNINILKERAQTFLYLAYKEPKYFNKALETLVQITKLAPTDAKTFQTIGQLYQAANLNDDAIIFFEKAIQLKSNYDDAHFALAKIYIDQKDFEKAKYHLNETLRIAPNNQEAKSLLSSLH